MPLKPTIGIRNVSTVVMDKEVQAAVAALQIQVSRDFAPAWGLDATLQFLSKTTPTPAGAWLVIISDTSDEVGALGYHDLTSTGMPLGKVFAKTTKQYGQSWSVCLSHEILEMIADPNINLCAFDEAHGRFYAYEVCDAVEADSLGYKINNILLSDFVFPGWFEPLNVSPGEKFAFKTGLSAPLQLAAGGYISYFSASRGWQQIFAHRTGAAQKMDEHDQAHPTSRAPVGSRRERRRTPKSQWNKSTVE